MFANKKTIDTFNFLRDNQSGTWVDGFRGYIPLPIGGHTPNPKLTKWDYKVGKIIHSGPGYKGPFYSFDSFLSQANITVVGD